MSPDAYVARRERLPEAVTVLSLCLIGPCLLLACLLSWAFGAGAEGDRLIIGACFLATLAVLAVYAIATGRHDELPAGTILQSFLLGGATASLVLWFATSLLPSDTWLCIGILVTWFTTRVVLKAVLRRP